MTEIHSYSKQIYKIALLVIALIFLSGCWVTPEPEPPEPNGTVYRALLVGVGDYMYISDLKSPFYNVDRMRKIFTDCRFTEAEIQFMVINELKDLEATKEAILEAITSTFAGADDNDISYFYWNGHGGEKIEPHIHPSDSKKTPTTWISVHELEEYLSAVPGMKIVIMDTCYSGGFIGKSFSKALLISDDYQVITSCAGDSVCWENPNSIKPYCYFTMGIYQGCIGLQADTDKDGIINLTELWDYAYWWAIQNKCNCQYAQYFPEGSEFPIVEY